MDNCYHLVEGVDPAHALATDAAIRAHPLRLDVHQGLADQRCHLVRPLDLPRAVPDDANVDLLVRVHRPRCLAQRGPTVTRPLSRLTLDAEPVPPPYHPLPGV